MDRDLLNALQNIGDQLDILSQILSQKKETSSDVATALISGDFSEQLKSISVEIKSIKADTQEILKTQQTILSMSKQKEKEKFGVFDESGKQESNLKKGAVVILGIAAAVLAVGTAFNLIGDVNVASVLSLTVAIGIIALSFERLAESKLTIANVFLAGALMVSMSVGIVMSSYILGLTSKVSNENLLTTIGIAAAFSLISLSIGKMISGIKDVKMSDLPIITLAMLFIYPAIATGIWLSSLVLQYVQPIGLGQLFTGILVAGLFVVLSYSIKNIMKGLEGVKPETALTASITIPILFTALSWAIAGSSMAISQIVPITSFAQFITALGISILFVALSYAVKPILAVSREIKIGDVIGIPLMFTALSIAISYSSKYLKDTEIIDYGALFKIVVLGIGLAIMTTALAIPAKMLADIGITKILQGSVAIVALAGAIALSSQLLSFGDYSDYPNIGWALGVGLSLAAFGKAATVLGLLVFGPQALVFAAGLAAILGVAGTIVAVSHILKAGDYNVPGMLSWATSTALLYATFAPIMVVLGAVGLASSVLGFFGANPWEKAKEMMLSIAQTIVDVSFIFKKGQYVGGPTKEWAEGVGTAIGAFSPVYAMLLANEVFSIFSSGEIGPEQFSSAINTVADGIISVAGKFKGVEFIMGPTKQWAEGVGTAIGAFSPVYAMLVANKLTSWLGGEIGPEQFNEGIKTVSLGIIEAAKIFQANTAPFEEGKYPSENWGKGVGGALAAFAPVYEALMNKGFFTSGKEAINNMTYGVSALTNSIVATAVKFLGINWDSYPTTTWVDNVAGVIYKYVSLIDRLSKLENIKYWVATSVASRMVNFANILAKGKEAFSLTIPPDFIQNISKNVLDFDLLVKDIIKNRQDDTISFNIFAKDPVLEIANNMITLANGYDKLASSLTNLGNSMKGLNVDSLRSLALLTNVMVNPNVTVPTAEIEKEFSEVKTVTSPTTLTSTTASLTTTSMDDKLESMIQLLVGIQANTISLNRVIQMMSEERIKKHEVD